MRGSPPPLWFCPRHWLQTTPKTTATWASSNSFPLPARPTAFGGRSRRARRSVLWPRITDSWRPRRARQAIWEASGGHPYVNRVGLSPLGPEYERLLHLHRHPLLILIAART